MRKHMILDVRLDDCQRLADPKDLHHFGDLLAQHGFHMVVFPVPGGEGVVLKGAEIGDYLVQTWPEEVRRGSAVWGDMPIPYGRNLLAIGMEDLIWGCDLAYKAGRTGVLIGGLVDFEFRDQRAWVEPFAQRLYGLARDLYPELQPALVSVDETGSLHHDFNDILKRRLKYINWVNLFGPPYVEKYGRDFLLGLPGYKVEEMPDGGVFHQLSPTFLTDDPKGAKALRQKVVGYCAQAGLKVVCKAPYRLPGIPSPATPQVSDKELKAYLKEMLGVTLLLDDGTRVKPIYIEWDILTPHQRQMALDAVRAAAITEIRQHRDKRIRFEFNVLPDELDQMMADLVGRDNPDFEYVQVDMGSR